MVRRHTPLSVGFVIIVYMLLSGIGFAQESTTGDQAVRVGIFDSRIVAIAYARSAAFMESVTMARKEYAAAEEDGDKERMDEIGKKMHAQQDLFHKQAFSIWPVRDILETIEDKLPGIAEAAQVQMLLSKWDIAFQTEGLSFVDVSMDIARLFDPDEETMNILAQVAEKEPVPVEELKHEH